MDFTLSEQQQAIGELAETILGDTVPPEVLRHLEAGSDRLAAAAWQALAAPTCWASPCPRPTGVPGSARSTPAWSPSRWGATWPSCPTGRRWRPPPGYRPVGTGTRAPAAPGAVSGDGPLPWPCGARHHRPRRPSRRSPAKPRRRLAPRRRQAAGRPLAGHAAAIVVPATVEGRATSPCSPSPPTPGVAARSRGHDRRAVPHGDLRRRPVARRPWSPAPPAATAPALSPTWPAPRPRCCAPRRWA